ncbi:retinoic acid-induced protein 2-like [Brienomyrus brachyistius]|uniref:retinoic acid-induced protein 2-like n=1 Tax=Brienomyrus brachyistius TaxID=42636 RepID=UPI0020B1E246|nr:retinoic acid-induced protein 2-like [Brienomyrus brachyistius]
METGQPGLPLDVASPPATVSTTDGSGKLENGIAQLITAEAWNINPGGLVRKPLSPVVAVPAPSLVTPASETPGSVALKVATAVLQPICLGESPVVLPIHLQMAGSTVPPMGPHGNASYLMAGQAPVPLPLVLEQQVFQHLNSPVLQQGTPCPTAPLQASAPLPFAQAVPPDQKPPGQAQDPGLLPLLQSPGFAAILQDLFPSVNNLNPPTCHPTAPAPSEHFPSALFPPPPLSHLYSSPLSPLVPPATLLVPYPVIVPLPVPVPVPIPVPIPIPQNTESKGFMDPPKPACTSTKSTQTHAKGPPSPSQGRGLGATAHLPQLLPQCSFALPEGEALDLSVKAVPIQTKREVPFQPDGILDLSVPGTRKSCIQSFFHREPPVMYPERSAYRAGEDATASLSLEVLRPMDGVQRLDPKLLSSLASLEFSRQRKWLVDGGGGRPGGEPKCGIVAGAAGAGDFEIVSTSQTAKVIVSVKDAMPAIFCGKIKGLSGVSTKNFSIRRDGNQEALLQQCYGARVPGEPCSAADALKKTAKSRAIKLKKVNSQEIHILPIKKQRLAAFFPRK